MAFENIRFIKCKEPFLKEFSLKNMAPMFRKKINIDEFENAKIRICGLGYVHCYLNGKKITDNIWIV